MRGNAHDLLTIAADSAIDWQLACSSAFVPLRISGCSETDFRAQMQMRTFDDISLCGIRAQAHTVVRTPELIVGDVRPHFKISLQIAGRGRLIQDHRSADLVPGDLAVYDTSRPYRLEFDGPFRSMVLIFPHSRLGLDPDSIAALTAVRLRPDMGLGPIISPFLLELAKNLNQISGESGMRLSLNVIDIITTMFAQQLADSGQARSTREVAIADIRRYIDDRLSDPELSPETIAEAHFISLRGLYSLFQADGTTVAGWIRQRRLERCRRDLSDPRCANHRVGVIAARWGFLDAAHFSHVFRAAYGTSPGAYRKALRTPNTTPPTAPAGVPQRGRTLSRAC